MARSRFHILAPNRSAKSAAAGIGFVGGAVIAAAMALIEPHEGTRLEPYRDMVGVWTVCTGETRVPMRRYSRTECRAMLRRAIESDYGAGVLAAVPTLQERPHQLTASISLAYNIGVPAFTRSTAARRFRAGDWQGGCDAFLLWDQAGGRAVRGLARRRAAERAVCVTGLG